jgi:hypothetical protein
MSNIIFDEQEDDWWTCTNFEVNNTMPKIRLTLTSDDKPNQDYISAAFKLLKDIDKLILMASELILENYSYEHFKNLGVNESLLLKDETPEAMSTVVQLESVWLMNPDCDEFEMSFSVPWDDYHSFDVEFESGEAVCCSVNG